MLIYEKTPHLEPFFTFQTPFKHAMRTSFMFRVPRIFILVIYRGINLSPGLPGKHRFPNVGFWDGLFWQDTEID